MLIGINQTDLNGVMLAASQRLPRGSGGSKRGLASETVHAVVATGWIRLSFLRQFDDARHEVNGILEDLPHPTAVIEGAIERSAPLPLGT